MEPDDDNMAVRLLERLVVPTEGAPCVIDLDALREKRLPQNRPPSPWQMEFVETNAARLASPVALMQSAAFLYQQVT